MNRTSLSPPQNTLLKTHLAHPLTPSLPPQSSISLNYTFPFIHICHPIYFIHSHTFHSFPLFYIRGNNCFHHFFISIISIQFAPHALSCLSFCQVHVRLLILTRRLVSVAKAAVPLLSFPSLIDHHPRWIRHCRISSSSSLISSLVVFLSVSRILNSSISLRRRRTVLGSLLR